MINAAEEVEEADENNKVCANCGVAEVDDIQLEDCDRCDLVKYCSDKCKEEHREQHAEECKKRKAKLHDKKNIYTAQWKSSRRVSNLLLADAARSKEIYFQIMLQQNNLLWLRIFQFHE